MATLRTNPSEVKKIAKKMETFKENLNKNIELVKKIREEACKKWQGDDADKFMKKLDNYLEELRKAKNEAGKHYKYLINGSHMFEEFEKSYNNVIGSDK